MSLVSVPSLKAYLNITRDVSNTELQVIIDAAEAAIANYVGPLAVGDSTTVRVNGGAMLVLPAVPVDAVTVIETPDGQVIDLALVTVNQASGLVYYNDNYSGFSSPVYDVTFTTGWATDSVPGDVVLAIMELCRHLWRPQLGGGSRANTGDAEAPGAGYMLTPRVEQLIEPYRRINIGAA